MVSYLVIFSSSASFWLIYLSTKLKLSVFLKVSFRHEFDSNAFFLVFCYDVSSRTMEFHIKLHSSQTPDFRGVFQKIILKFWKTGWRPRCSIFRNSPHWKYIPFFMKKPSWQKKLQGLVLSRGSEPAVILVAPAPNLRF